MPKIPFAEAATLAVAVIPADTCIDPAFACAVIDADADMLAAAKNFLLAADVTVAELVTDAAAPCLRSPADVKEATAETDPAASSRYCAAAVVDDVTAMDAAISRPGLFL